MNEIEGVYGAITISRLQPEGCNAAMCLRNAEYRIALENAGGPSIYCDLHALAIRSAHIAKAKPEKSGAPPERISS
jgi:hypothetical protein